MTPPKEQGSLGRAMRMGKVGLGIASSYIGYQLQSFYLDPQTSREKRKGMNQRNSKRLRQELQSMRGPAMKLGQTLSMQGHFFPPEVVEELATLQMKAPPMHQTLMRIQFRNALNQDPEELFKTFEMEPFAAASLGQVHRATTRNGEKVAVKIQYPAIRDVIENDFHILRTATIPAKLTGHFPAAAIQELERGILEETDYENEARNLSLFRKGLKPLAYARVPQVHPELSTDRVLTMSFMEGSHLTDFLASKPSQALRNLVGSRLLELLCFQLHGVQALHADPHSGNYLFDSEGRIALLDFGCVKHLCSNTITLCGKFADRTWEKRSGEFDDMVRRTWGSTATGNSSRARRVMKEVIAFYDLLYPPGHTANDSVDFGSPKLIETLTRVWHSAFRSKLLNPEFFFTSRTEMGIYNILHTLKAKVPTVQILSQVMQRVRGR